MFFTVTSPLAAVSVELEEESLDALEELEESELEQAVIDAAMRSARTKEDTLASLLCFFILVSFFLFFPFNTTKAFHPLISFG